MSPRGHAHGVGSWRAVEPSHQRRERNRTTRRTRPAGARQHADGPRMRTQQPRPDYRCQDVHRYRQCSQPSARPARCPGQVLQRRAGHPTSAAAPYKAPPPREKPDRELATTIRIATGYPPRNASHLDAMGHDLGGPSATDTRGKCGQGSRSYGLTAASARRRRKGTGSPCKPSSTARKCSGIWAGRPSSSTTTIEVSAIAATAPSAPIIS